MNKIHCDNCDSIIKYKSSERSYEIAMPKSGSHYIIVLPDYDLCIGCLSILIVEGKI